MNDIIYFKVLDYQDIKRNMYIITSTWLIYNSTGRIAKYFISNTGYYRINLMCEDGSSRNFSVHVLVAESFIPKPDNHHKWIINHIDGNKLHDDITNLEWVTYRENWYHAMDTIHTITNYGDTASRRKPEKYSVQMVKDICELLSIRYYKANEIIEILHLVSNPEDKHSDEYRTMRKFIKNIRQRRCWKCISNAYVWAESGSSTMERVY